MLEKLLRNTKYLEKFSFLIGDFHITRSCCAYVFIRNGKVIYVLKPKLESCPVADHLYGKVHTQKTIKEHTQEKINKFGYFTKNRETFVKNVAIPFGASEIMMYAMEKGKIDAAVVVTDGAGTIITATPEVVQGIGARINGIFFTSPIKEVIQNFEKYNAMVVFPETARIDQISGLEKAAELGYKKIAVTIAGNKAGELLKIEKIEEKYNIDVTSLVVCTTGVTKKDAEYVKQYGDLVWTCASKYVREVVGPNSLAQLGRKIPVFAITQKGLDLICAYSRTQEGKLKTILHDCENCKYLLSLRGESGERVSLGEEMVTVQKVNNLPVRDEKEPFPLI